MDRQQILALVSGATLAPSSHNTQPWLFRLSESAIDVFADRTRALPVNDPDDRELTISCGCALMNLRVLAAINGFQSEVELLPDPQNLNWLARATLGQGTGVPAKESTLAEFVERRRTYRRHFASSEVSSAALAQLLDAAQAEGAWLRPIPNGEPRRQAASLVAEGDAAQWANPCWRRELAFWIRSRRRGDGLAVPALAVPVAQLVIRAFDMGSHVGAKDRGLAEASPLLAVLGTSDDHPSDWLRAGQALQRILLVACSHGLQASFLNQPIQVGRLRPRLQNIVGSGLPQVLLRLGYPTGEIPAAPRRDVGAVIEEAETQRASVAR